MPPIVPCSFNEGGKDFGREHGGVRPEEQRARQSIFKIELVEPTHLAGGEGNTPSRNDNKYRDNDRMITNITTINNQ